MLTCSCCGAEFIGSNHQRFSARHGKNVCCSFPCSKIGRGWSGPFSGTCKTCGKAFVSRVKGKLYCNMACYAADPAAAERVRGLARKALAVRLSNLGMSNEHLNSYAVPCAECGNELVRKLSNINRHNFCNQSCYRRFMAARFDRWIASPESIALPQNYDEFLTQEELPCLVDGCTWIGRRLSQHANLAHGITAEEFKRMAGFNKGTGLVTADQSKIFSDRQKKLLGERPDIVAAFLASAQGEHVVGASLEAHEHRIKAVKLLAFEAPSRQIVCRECGVVFTFAGASQKTYCSVKCRDRHYQRRNAVQRGVATCSHCGETFAPNRQQELRFSRGLPVCCSSQCRQVRNITMALVKRGVR